MTINSHAMITGILICIAFILYGCAGNNGTISPDQTDKSVFLGNSCAAPCWYGLEIGKSNKAEVMSVLAALEFIDQKTIQINSISIPAPDSTSWVSGERIIANCKQSRKPCLVLNLANGKLRDIREILNTKITLDEVIGYLGRPDKVGLTICCPEAMACEIQLIWIKEQLVLTSKSFSGEDGCKYSITATDTGIVDSDLDIAAVDYLPIGDINHLVKDTDSVGDFRDLRIK